MSASRIQNLQQQCQKHWTRYCIHHQSSEYSKCSKLWRSICHMYAQNVHNSI